MFNNFNNNPFQQNNSLNNGQGNSFQNYLNSVPNYNQTNNNQSYMQPYPSNYGNPTTTDVLFKTFLPDESGGSMNTADWIKYIGGSIGDLWKKHQDDSDMKF
jgi:hypothetical protein